VLRCRAVGKRWRARDDGGDEQGRQLLGGAGRYRIDASDPVHLKRVMRDLHKAGAVPGRIVHLVGT